MYIEHDDGELRPIRRPGCGRRRCISRGGFLWCPTPGRSSHGPTSLQSIAVGKDQNQVGRTAPDLRAEASTADFNKGWCAPATTVQTLGYHSLAIPAADAKCAFLIICGMTAMDSARSSSSLGIRLSADPVRSCKTAAALETR